MCVGLPVQTASLGTYTHEADAARAYDAAHFDMYGRLDLLNFPDDVEEKGAARVAAPSTAGDQHRHCSSSSLYSMHWDRLTWGKPGGAKLIFETWILHCCMLSSITMQIHLP